MVTEMNLIVALWIDGDGGSEAVMVNCGDLEHGLIGFVIESGE
jgi:hypothetical protein